VRILAALLSPLVLGVALAFTGPIADADSVADAAQAVGRLFSVDWSRTAAPPRAALDQFTPKPEPLHLPRVRPPLPDAYPCPFHSRHACRVMDDALARGDPRVCNGHRWRRLFHFRSVGLCQEFVRENAG
jgi:hypothetical protein